MDGQPVAGTECPVSDPADDRVRFIQPNPAAPAVRELLSCLSHGQEFCIGQPRPSAKGRPGCFQCFSSGTTGASKRIRRTLESWTKSFDVNATRWSLGAADRYAVLGELRHSLALYALLEALHVGACLDVLSTLPVRRQWAALVATPPTLLYATPAQLRLLHDVAGDGTVTATRRVAIGGGFLDERTRSQSAALFPNAQISVFYGASETSFITLADEDTPPGSVGRAYPRVELHIRDMDGHNCPPGTAGEIWVRSPYLFEGYAEGRAERTRWNEGYLTVGDVGYLDAQGYLHLVGRSDRMFTVADQNLFPEEIETYLRAQPGIREAAVLPRADSKRGTVPVACLHADLDESDLEKLAAACRRTFGPMMAPRQMLPITDWPRLPSGKTDLQHLQRIVGNAP